MLSKTETVVALASNFSKPVRDPLWGHIYMTDSLLKLTRTPQFMRLHRIMQLGPAYMRYPGATHSRASHSIGVYHLARRLLWQLAQKGAGEWLTGEGINSFLCAALLHDVGHFPYAHSLKELVPATHEELSAAMITGSLSASVAACGSDPVMSAAIIDHNMPDNNSKELVFYRKLLSGVLDPDKLDYLCRDAYFCGVPYGVQDVDFILNRLRPDMGNGVIIHADGIQSVEALLFSKYLMYKSVYWHHTVRSATSLIKKALWNALASGCLQCQELYNLDDNGLFALLASKDNELCRRSARLSDGSFFVRAVEIDNQMPGYSRIVEAVNTPAKAAAAAAKLANAVSSEEGVTVRPEEIIVDLPEEVDFETDLIVVRSKRVSKPFRQSTSLFGRRMLHNVSSTLRRIRIFIDRKDCDVRLKSAIRMAAGRVL
jgi:HD superfamily phosphohydrolase